MVKLELRCLQPEQIRARKLNPGIQGKENPSVKHGIRFKISEQENMPCAQEAGTMIYAANR